MSDLIMGMQGVLAAGNDSIKLDRIFGLDLQLLIDIGIAALAIFVLFAFLSYLVFNPARELLKKRQENIQAEMDTAAKEKADAMKFKSDYDMKLKNADKETEQILSEARKKALKREGEIVDEAKVEASRIIDRANKEIELEKTKMKDEVKTEMIAVASVMAGKIITASIDEKKQAELIDETLKEMGDSTWQN